MRTSSAIVLAACLAAAATPLATAAQSYYDVEIIVFQQLNVTPETLASATPLTTVFPETPPPAPETTEALPPERLRLVAAWQHLRRSKEYRPLLHTSWRQQVLGPRNAQPRPVFVQTPEARVDGQLRIYAETFLHVDVDLGLELANEGGYRLRDNRRIRSREIHYFDHARFGLLLILTPS